MVSAKSSQECDIFDRNPAADSALVGTVLLVGMLSNFIQTNFREDGLLKKIFLKKSFFFVPNFCFQKITIFRFFSVKFPLYRFQQGSFINHQSHKKFKARYFENYLEFVDNIAPSCSSLLISTSYPPNMKF